MIGWDRIIYMSDDNSKDIENMITGRKTLNAVVGLAHVTFQARVYVN